MELALREAKARLSELIAAAEKGERVVITKHGQPAAELVRFRQRGGVDFDRLAKARARLGFAEEGSGWPAALDEPALSRQVLDLKDDWPAAQKDTALSRRVLGLDEDGSDEGAA